MAFDGNGTFLRIMNWVADAASAIKIKADRHDQQDDDFAAGLTNCLTKDGQTQPTANLPMNGKKLINLGDPTAPTDAANKQYVDAVKTFSQGLEISGANNYGRLSFTSATGINGLSFTGADLGWFARLADAGATPPTKNRMVLNDKPDGSGADVITANDDGSFVAVKAYAKTEIGLKPTVGLGTLAFYAVDGTTVRAKWEVSSGAAADVNFTVDAKVFTFGIDGSIKAAGRHYAGAAFLETNGNLSGTIWSAWGSSSAFDAISARIENRAAAFANDRVANLQYRKTSPGSFFTPDNGLVMCPSGAVLTGINMAGTSNNPTMYYHFLQVFDPVRGWVGFTG